MTSGAVPACEIISAAEVALKEGHGPVASSVAILVVVVTKTRSPAATNSRARANIKLVLPPAPVRAIRRTVVSPKQSIKIDLSPRLIERAHYTF